jgi:multisubunit Na+/H+ antiporter MnhB subunit
MENMLIVAIITTLLFCAFKFVEMRFIDKQKEMKPLKFFVRDLVLVFISSLAAGFFFFNSNKQISEFVNTITDTKVIPEGAAQVFTDAPGF